MEANRIRMRKIDAQQKLALSAISTITFVIFTIMHVTLSYEQYDVTRMSAFNRAVTLSSIPQVDTDVPVAAKQFTSRE